MTVVEYRELDSTNIEDIIKLAFDIDAKAQVIVGIGGGKVIDVAKYAAYLRKLPFISIPTSASSDGFSSASASLMVNGRRTSVPARMAYGIIADTEIINLHRRDSFTQESATWYPRSHPPTTGFSSQTLDIQR